MSSKRLVQVCIRNLIPVSARQPPNHHSTRSTKIMLERNKTNTLSSLLSIRLQQRVMSSTSRRKKTKIPSISKIKSQKLKDTINSKRILEETSKEHVTKVETHQQQQHQHQHQKLLQSQEVKQDVESSFPFWKAFFTLGVFPIVATGTLVFFNEEMKDDFMNRFGNDIMQKLGIDNSKS